MARGNESVNIGFESSTTKTEEAIGRIEQKLVQMEDKFRRVSRVSKASTDTTVQGMGQATTAIGQAAAAGRQLMSALGITGGVGIAALATMASRQFAAEADARGREALERERELAGITLGSGDLSRMAEIREALRSAGGPASERDRMRVFQGMRDVLPQDRMASLDEILRLSQAGVSTFGTLYSGDDQKIGQSSRLMATFYRMLREQDPGVASRPGVADQLASMVLYTMQSSGGQSPETMLRGAQLLGSMRGGGDPIRGLSLTLAAQQEALLRNQSPEAVQTMIRNMSRVSGMRDETSGAAQYPEFSVAVERGGGGGGLEYLLSARDLEPGLGRALAGEQVAVLEMLRQNFETINGQAESIRQSFEEGRAAADMLQEFGRQAPNVMAERQFQREIEQMRLGREDFDLYRARMLGGFRAGVESYTGSETIGGALETLLAGAMASPGTNLLMRMMQPSSGQQMRVVTEDGMQALDD